VNGKGGIFDCVSWSPTEAKVLYSAEPTEVEGINYFDPPKEKAVPGTKYDFKPTWGEGASGSSFPSLYIFDTEKLTIINPLEKCADMKEFSVGQGCFAPDGESIVFVAWPNQPRLGIIYCWNRLSTIYQATLTENPTATRISAANVAARSPLFNPDGSQLVWLESTAGGPHVASTRLMASTWSPLVDTPRIIIDFSNDERNPGLFLDRLPPRCWVKNNTIVCATFRRSTEPLALIDVSAKTLKYIDTALFSARDEGSWTVLDVSDGNILASYCDLSLPPVLCAGKYVPEEHGNGDSFQWTKLTKEARRTDFTWAIKEHAGTPTTWESILVQPTALPAAGCGGAPLLVVPHGGPHAVFAAEYITSITAFASLGYAVLLVNYRGSAGFGQACIDSLPGKVGVLDVNDVNDSVSCALADNAGKINPQQVVIHGGSHGGLLGAHLTAQFPERYKAAVLRNPVVDLVAMLAVTDIPDWVLVEAGFTYDTAARIHDLTPDHYAKMRAASPIAHVANVRAPTLVMLGAKDLRVPPSQGKLWADILATRRVPVRLMSFPQADHNIIGTVEYEAETFVLASEWFRDHVTQIPANE